MAVVASVGSSFWTWFSEMDAAGVDCPGEEALLLTFEGLTSSEALAPFTSPFCAPSLLDTECALGGLPDVET
jgi:hypothetical protein